MIPFLIPLSPSILSAAMLETQKRYPLKAAKRAVPETEFNADTPHVSPLAPIAILIGMFACTVRAYVWNHHRLNGEAPGYAFGGMLLALLVAYAIAGRKKVRNRNRLSAWFCVVSIFELLLELSSKH